MGKKEKLDKYGTNSNVSFGDSKLFRQEDFIVGWDACRNDLNKDSDDKEILAKVAERINRSKPMPKEFSKIIDEVFGT